MNLPLTEIEAGVLKIAIDAHLTEAETELARTDDREYRHRLRLDLDALEKIRDRLAALMEKKIAA